MHSKTLSKSPVRDTNMLVLPSARRESLNETEAGKNVNVINVEVEFDNKETLDET